MAAQRIIGRKSRYHVLRAADRASIGATFDDLKVAQQRADDMARTMRRAYAVFDYADDEGVLVYLAEGRTT